MASYRTHITILAEIVSKHPSSPAFRTPIVDPKTGSVLEWKTISYSQFQSDVELFARYWSRTLSADGIAQRSVVGLWFVIVLSVIFGLTRTLSSGSAE